MLVEFAGMLHRAVLGSDVVARLGGDEFVMVLQDIDVSGQCRCGGTPVAP